jgi:hypothetical protein
MHITALARAATLTVLAGAALQAQAVGFTQGDVTLDINGTVNGFYMNREDTVTDKATGTEAKATNSMVSNGLLPGWLNFVATTKAADQDIKVHFGFAPGIVNNSSVVGLPDGAAGNTPGAYSQIDTRNIYFRFGNENWGHVKFGRDIGLFGQDVILSDMTLIGVGGTTNAAMPFNTTFGMIGHGYMYTGFQPQISYDTPKVNGCRPRSASSSRASTPVTRPRRPPCRPAPATAGPAPPRARSGRAWCTRAPAAPAAAAAAAPSPSPRKATSWA